jgi:hypothetical protein
VFTATIDRFGRRNLHRIDKDVVWTILLNNITDRDGNIVADHLWLNLNKEFDKLNIREGDRVEFSAKVIEYYKQNHRASKEKDYKLDKLVGVKKITDTPDENKV